ncbi:glycosyltransferase [Rheinheimera maricola]|uniref:Glycosyltransferase n=1 Tax=Rheinheimera maricola TaxID=2793282 RepID=A0ABS7X563_9GAMM|nr:glycosyltransferase [Rheinheimera maricola]MBZ9610295.1 glycosyltransferase [Rheinheimera maricola]
MSEHDVQRLLVVMESFVMGGVERVTLRLLQALQEQYTKLNIVVAVQQNSGALATEFSQTLTVVELPPGSIAQAKALRGLVTQQQSQLVLFTKGGLSRYQLCLPRKVRSVVVQHVPLALPGLSNGKNLLRRVFAALCFRLVDKVVTVSDGLNQDVCTSLKLAPTKVVTIYNPVLTEALAGMAEQPLPAQMLPLTSYFICVGRLDYQKGYDMLLKIWQQPQLQQQHVCIIGDGPLLHELSEQIVQLGLSERVHLLGSHNNPYCFMRHATALLLPSRFEGLPTVLVEAAALGRQLVAFDCPYGPAELLNEGRDGYLIAAGDITAFADAVAQVAHGQYKPLPDVSAFFAAAAAENYFQLFTQLFKRH